MIDFSPLLRKWVDLLDMQKISIQSLASVSVTINPQKYIYQIWNFKGPKSPRSNS